MKRGVLRGAGRLAAGLAGVMAVMIAVNLLLFGFAVSYLAGTVGGRVRVSEYAGALAQDGSGAWSMAENKAEELRERGCWAMLLDAAGEVIWSQDMPEGLPRAYSPAEAAVFARWYLFDWPVKVWTVGDCLFVLAQPKGSVWKYQVEMPTEQVGFWPLWGMAMLAVNAGMLLGAAAFITRRAARRRDEARSEWIAAISHDVRTPLTTLMGYLDILGESDNLTPSQRQEYLSVCRQKAEKLRTLTNELFSYFLVFGKPTPALHLEPLDAGTLLEQMLGEQTADLLERNYQVQTESLTESRLIQVDVQHLRRIFDNLFSNVLKYAEPDRPVTISSSWVGNELHVCISNYVRATAGRVESTKIGLQTCEKLLTSMGGRFLRRQEGGLFTAEVILPAGCPLEAV